MGKLPGMHDFHSFTSICRSIVAGELVVEENCMPLIALCAKERESPSFVRPAEQRLLVPK